MSIDAFPVVPNRRATQEYASSAAEGRSYAASYPPYKVGDMMLLILGAADNDTGLVDWVMEGFTLVGTVTNLTQLAVWFKVMDGTEDPFLLVKNPNAQLDQNVALSIIIEKATGTPEMATAISTVQSPALTPAWGAANTLWVAGYVCRRNGKMEAPPPGYDRQFGHQGTASVNGDCSGWAAFLESNTATETPGAPTVSGENNRAIASTIAIQPE